MTLDAYTRRHQGRRLSGRTLLAGLALAFAAALAAPSTALAGDRDDGWGRRWLGTWTAAPAGPAGLPQVFTNQTLRLIVHTSVGGDEVRVRISNTFGSEPLVIGAAHIARRASGATVVQGSDRTLTFGGLTTATVPAGALVVSDPVRLRVPELSDLAVSLYLPGTASALTIHPLALQTSYLSAAASGDQTSAVDFAGASTLNIWPFLTGVEVAAGKHGRGIVTLGNSITDGASSTPSTNRRWPDFLARRLQASRHLDEIGVMNAGISGNRLLHGTGAGLGNLFGPAGLARFDRDVLAQSGVKYVIVLLGINDIGQPGSSAPVAETVTVPDMIQGYRQLVERAHAKGLKIYGATLTPFENTTIAGYYSPEKETMRQAVNAWIRNSGAFDAVIDFDKAVRDPSHPTRMLPAYDSGDHLHPSDAGMQAMTNAIDLDLFRNED